MKRTCRFMSAVVLMMTMATAAVPAQTTFAAPEDIFIRVNQVGYKTTAAKTAMVMTRSDLSGKDFSVLDDKGTEVFSGKIGADNGSWGNLGKNYDHTYTVDFSGLNARGENYRISVDGNRSPAFDVRNDVYDGLPELSLKFFGLQRCGDTAPTGHEACHLDDGVVVSGVNEGKKIDVSGGWHDAADYIKFMSTIGYCSNIMLSSYLNNPGQFDDPARGILAETRVGLDFMMKMWDNDTQTLYLSVADADEHGAEDTVTRWETRPEKDTFYKGPRPVYPCDPGKGANIAGKASAALAMAAKIWGDKDGPCHDAALAGRYLEAAKQIYIFGKNNPATMSDRDGGYEELPEAWAWKDDMALAAAELYRATGTPAYLLEAEEYANSLGDNGDGDYSNINLSWSRCCHYVNDELARLDPAYAPIAAVRMYTHLSKAREYAMANVWETGLSELRWGSGAMMSQLVVEACMYKRLTGDSSFMYLAQKQVDYLFGANPWGVSMLNGAGETYVRHPRHRITYQQQVLNGKPEWNPVGLWSEGPVSEAVYTPNQNDPMDPDLKFNTNYDDFQDKTAVWHDNRMDFVTNEACINANAAGVAAMAWFAETSTGKSRAWVKKPRPAAGSAGADEYPVTADAYIRDGESSGINYGSESTLTVKGDTDAGYSRKALLKADLTGFKKDSATTAQLKIYSSSANSDTPVVVYGLADDRWDEKTVTWDNPPSVTGATRIGTLTFSAEGWYTLDITGYVSSQLSGDKTVTLLLQNENTDGVSTTLSSREGVANKPVLVVK